MTSVFYPVFRPEGEPVSSKCWKSCCNGQISSQNLKKVQKLSKAESKSNEFMICYLDHKMQTVSYLTKWSRSIENFVFVLVLWYYCRRHSFLPMYFCFWTIQLYQGSGNCAFFLTVQPLPHKALRRFWTGKFELLLWEWIPYRRRIVWR